MLSKNLTLLMQIHLFSQCNFSPHLYSEYGGASLKACTVAHRPFLLVVYSTESVEGNPGVCATLTFNQDLLLQFIQEIKTLHINPIY